MAGGDYEEAPSCMSGSAATGGGGEGGVGRVCWGGGDRDHECQLLKEHLFPAGSTDNAAAHQGAGEAIHHGPRELIGCPSGAGGGHLERLGVGGGLVGGCLSGRQVRGNPAGTSCGLKAATTLACSRQVGGGRVAEGGGG